MQILLTFNTINECLIVPQLAFGQIFQWKEYGQYKLHTKVL
jgi:hypothetical protein